MIKIVLMQSGLNGKRLKMKYCTQDHFTFPQVVDLEGRHLLGEDGLGQVEQGGVIDREVTVVLVQNPHRCSLNTALHKRKRKKNKVLP